MQIWSLGDSNRWPEWWAFSISGERLHSSKSEVIASERSSKVLSLHPQVKCFSFCAPSSFTNICVIWCVGFYCRNFMQWSLVHRILDWPVSLYRYLVLHMHAEASRQSHHYSHKKYLTWCHRKPYLHTLLICNDKSTRHFVFLTQDSKSSFILSGIIN